METALSASVSTANQAVPMFQVGIWLLGAFVGLVLVGYGVHIAKRITGANRR